MKKAKLLLHLSNAETENLAGNTFFAQLCFLCFFFSQDAHSRATGNQKTLTSPASPHVTNSVNLSYYYNHHQLYSGTLVFRPEIEQRRQ